MTITPTAIRIVRAVATPGEFQLAEWETTVKPAAAHKARVLRKRTVAAVECGTAYGDLAEVKAGIVAGARGEVQSLPWGEWAAYPYIVTHKGREYVRFNLATAGIVSVTYTVDGAEVTREEFNSYLTPAAARGGERPLTITVPVENLRRIGEVTLAA
jgi:hypothetical protein